MAGGFIRSAVRTMASASLAAALAAPAVARPGAPSLEGFTGQLTTPSAWVQDPGTAHLVFTNAPRTDPSTTRTFVLDVGVLPYLELAGRVTDVSSPPGPRDLSFNAKLQLPLDVVAPRLPVALAVGTQDEGGAATHFRTRYVVASARLWRATASLGWGTGPDRMDGLFGGGTLALLEGLEVLGEWDASHANAGLRLSVPLRRIGLPVRLGAIAMSSLGREPGGIEWGATLDLPLWLNARGEGRSAVPYRSPSPRGVALRQDEPPPGEIRPARAGRPAGADPSADSPRPATPLAPGTAARDVESLLALEEALLEIGFEEVRVGRDGDVLVVEYENSRFNHDEADGLHVVAREVELAGLSTGPLAIVLKQNGLRVVEIVRPGRPDAASGPPEGGARWRYHPRERPATWASPHPRNRRALHTALVLAPGLRTFVATEVGVLDYVVSFRPDVVVPFWPGATGFARFDVPLAWSDDLRAGGPLRRFRDDPRVEYALLHQALPIGAGLWAMVGGGVFRTTDAGGLGELLWTPGDGELALGAQGSWTANDAREERRGYTASARFRIAPLDLVATVRAGRFVNGDRGATVQLARWFGDTQVGVYYVRTEVALAGAFLSVPLTPRRDMRPGLIQVRGRRFGHDVGTVVGEERNPVTTGLGIAPLAPWNLEASYLDEGRVTRDGLTGALPGSRRGGSPSRRRAAGRGGSRSARGSRRAGGRSTPPP